MTREEMLRFIAANSGGSIESKETEESDALRISPWHKKLLEFEDRALRAFEDAVAYRQYLKLKRKHEGYSR